MIFSVQLSILALSILLISLRIALRRARSALERFSSRLTAASTAAGFSSLLTVSHDGCAPWVQMDVCTEGIRPGAVLNEDISKPALPERTHSAVARIKPRTIAGIEPLHPPDIRLAAIRHR